MKIIVFLLLLLNFYIGLFAQQKDTFIDTRDGKEYRIIKVGKQTWFAQNLAYKPMNGSFWAYGNDQANLVTYGYLYDWETAKNACPSGYHLPSDDEWKHLEENLGLAQNELNRMGWSKDLINAGGQLRDTTLWEKPNIGATNKTGFNALPAGFRTSKGSFAWLGKRTNFWTCTANGSYIWSRGLYCEFIGVDRYLNPRECGFSIRCLKN
jgi:uncharacterized protein (TIGR02145 family)